MDNADGAGYEEATIHPSKPRNPWSISFGIYCRFGNVHGLK